MRQNRIFSGQRDPNVIDINNPIDVEYVHHQFPWLSHKKIKEVIQKHGPDRDTVQSVLEKVGSGSDRTG